MRRDHWRRGPGRTCHLRWLQTRRPETDSSERHHFGRTLVNVRWTPNAEGERSAVRLAHHMAVRFLTVTRVPYVQMVVCAEREADVRHWRLDMACVGTWSLILRIDPFFKVDRSFWPGRRR